MRGDFRGILASLAGIALIIAQVLLIIGLPWHWRRKRTIETVLRESEERFRVTTDTTPSLIWMCDEEGNVTYLNGRRLAFTGQDPQAGFEDTWTAYVHPEDWQSVQQANSRGLESQEEFSKEYRLRRRDGVYRWMLDIASPRVNGDGSFAGFIGSAVDVTDQKLAQEALEKLSGRLIEAQEQERSRIGRELHDDICQRLALLAMELDKADCVANGAAGAMKKQMIEVRRHCYEIADDVQALSRQVHSPKLEHLGIVTALRSFSKEFSQQHQVKVEFAEENVPNPLPKDVSLALFRVAPGGAA